MFLIVTGMPLSYEALLAPLLKVENMHEKLVFNLMTVGMLRTRGEIVCLPAPSLPPFEESVLKRSHEKANMALV